MLTAVALAALSGNIFAETTVTMEMAAGVSDNISRTSENEDAAAIARAGIRFEFDEQTKRLVAKGLGGFSYNDYINANAYDDETLGFFDGTAVFTLKEDVLTWMAQDNFGQQLENTFGPPTPGNRENINYFTTGPDLNWQILGRTALTAGAKFSDVAYETTPLDNQRLGGTLGLQRQLSSSKSVSLNVGADQIDYSSTLYTDYDTSRAFIRFQSEVARTSLGLDLGWNQVKYGDQSGDGLLLDFSANRELSAVSSISLSLGSRYSDAGDIFRIYQDAGGTPGDTQDIEGRGSPFQNNYASFGVNFDKNRTSFNANLRFSDENYEAVTAPDRLRADFQATLTRQVRSNFDATMGANIYHRKYDESGRRDTDWSLYGELIWRYSRTLTGSVRLGHADRNSNSVGASYQENSLFVTLAYTPGY